MRITTGIASSSEQAQIRRKGRDVLENNVGTLRMDTRVRSDELQKASFIGKSGDQRSRGLGETAQKIHEDGDRDIKVGDRGRFGDLETETSEQVSQDEGNPQLAEHQVLLT